MSAHSAAPPPPPPADSAPDDLLAEILLRLPPHPSSLSRASLVCKRWRRLARDPGLLRRLRAFHRTPPVLGYFHNSPDLPRFVPTEASPGRITVEASSLRRNGEDGMWWFVDCRHGRALLRSRDWTDLLVWEPMTGERRCIPVPSQMLSGASGRSAAVLCTAAGVDGGCHSSPFHVVVVFASRGRVSACTYSSLTGAWGDLISTVVPSPCEVYEESPALVVGESLYWLLNRGSILEFGFSNQSLALIDHPVEMNAVRMSSIRAVRVEDDVLALGFLEDFSLHLWARKAAEDGAFKWMPHMSIELDKLLPLPMAVEQNWPVEHNRSGVLRLWISGFSEDGNLVFIRTVAGIFLVWLETLKFRKVSGSLLMKTIYPYASFYVPEGLGVQAI
ncbi:uncharacterized protein LOC102703339 [Oryza brachyantha]|uniref:uncharacterized protein LOC102703339 n=1 Tax=Oryza brachyantha TaxID=4533 RepID=UPI001ADBE2E5|nr:uncharacterized protein LOC102703339 [Oryza brachyantha]